MANRKNVKIKQVDTQEGKLTKTNAGEISKPKIPSRDEFNFMSIKNIYLTYEDGETSLTSKTSEVLFCNLMVYKAGIEFIKQIILSTSKTRADIRETIVRDILSDLFKYITDLSLINEMRYFEERIKLLTEILNNMMRIKIMIRLLYDTKQVKLKGFATIIRKGESFCPQINYWLNIQKKRLNQTLGPESESSK